MVFRRASSVTPVTALPYPTPALAPDLTTQSGDSVGCPALRIRGQESGNATLVCPLCKYTMSRIVTVALLKDDCQKKDDSGCRVDVGWMSTSALSAAAAAAAAASWVRNPVHDKLFCFVVYVCCFLIVLVTSMALPKSLHNTNY